MNSREEELLGLDLIMVAIKSWILCGDSVGISKEVQQNWIEDLVRKAQDPEECREWARDALG